MAMVGSLAALPSIAVDQTTGMPLHRRSSNTSEDAIHKRASLVLQMADSLVTSNHRRRHQLEQIASGKTDHVQQVIEDIMHEKPANLLDLLREVEPEALPSREELKERYSSSSKKKKIALATSSTMEAVATTENGPSDKQGKENDFGADTEDDEDESDEDEEEDDEDESESAHKDTQDLSKDELPIGSDTLREQLKRSYAAIVKMRENSDLRYEALEKKYNELKRAQKYNTPANNGAALHCVSPTSDASSRSQQSPAVTESEQLSQAYGAIVRLRENSDLRYNVLESKYVDLKRSHAEADARNERLEAEIETMRAEVARVTTLNNELNNKHGNMNNSMSNMNDSTRSLSQTFFPTTPSPSRRASTTSSLTSPSRRISSPAILATNNKKTKTILSDTKKALQLSSSAHKRDHAAYRKKVQTEKEKERMLRMTVCKEFVALCERVEKCKPCQSNVSQLALLNVKDQIEKLEAETEAAEQEAATNMMEDTSFREEDEDDADSEREDDDDDDEDADNSEREGSVDAISDSMKRHDGAMALLGANWEKLAEIEDHDEPKFDKPRAGRFGNLSESKTEQKLRGKQSRFVAAQSGVYCRIDHDMQNQYGNLDKFEAPTPTPRSPPVPPPQSSAQARHSPPRLTDLAGKPVLQAPPALKRPVPSSTGMEIHQDPPALAPYENHNNLLRNSISPPPGSVIGSPKSALKNSSDVMPPHPLLFNPSEAAFQISPTSVFVSEFALTAVDGKTTPPFLPADGGGGPMDGGSAESPTTTLGAVEVDGLIEVITPIRSNVLKPTSTSPPPPQRRSSIQVPLLDIDETSVMDSSASLSGSGVCDFDDFGEKKPAKPALRSPKKKMSKDRLVLMNGEMNKSVSFSSILSTSREHQKFPVEEEEAAKDDTAKDDATQDLMAPAAPGECDTGSVTSGGSKPIQGELEGASPNQTDNTERMSGSKKPAKAKLDPAEKKAKRESALKEAKLAARMVRKQQRGSSKKLLSADGEESSIISGISGASSLTSASAKPKKGGFFKNPFRKKNKALEAATAIAAGIPTEIKSGKATPAPPTRSDMEGSDMSGGSTRRMSAGPPAKAETDLTPTQKAAIARKAKASKIRSEKVKAAAKTAAHTPQVSTRGPVDC